MKKESEKRHKINFPTILTLLRIVLVVPFMFCCLSEDPEIRLLALDFFVIAAITDFIDGRLARKKNQVTDLGAFLDPLADKMLVNLALLVLCIEGVVPVWLLAIVLVRDYAVDGIRMAAARNGETIAASIWGKSKTMSQMIALVVILVNRVINVEVLGIIGMILLYISFALAVISGVLYIIKGWSKAIK